VTNFQKSWVATVIAASLSLNEGVGIQVVLVGLKLSKVKGLRQLSQLLQLHVHPMKLMLFQPSPPVLSLIARIIPNKVY
jgi:hypothetical protein